jgi:hypothetical protein
MGRKQITPQSPHLRGGRKAPARDTFPAGRSYPAVARCAAQTRGILPAGMAAAPQGGQRGPPTLPKRQGRWVAPPALTMPHAVRKYHLKGSHVQSRQCITGQADPEAADPRRSCPDHERNAP